MFYDSSINWNIYKTTNLVNNKLGAQNLVTNRSS